MVNLQNRLFRSTFREGGLTLSLKIKRFDAACSAEFKEECSKINFLRIRQMKVDLSKVEFIDSSGIGALLSIYRQLDQKKPQMKILHARPAIRTLIELLRLQKIFEII